MSKWLCKSEPISYSIEHLERDGETQWEGVRNYQARNFMLEMKVGDEVLFYHSQEGNCIMGKMKVIEEAHQDKTTDDSRWVSVTFEPLGTFENPIALAQIKKATGLANIGLIKQPRLAVMPLKTEEFREIISLQNK